MQPESLPIDERIPEIRTLVNRVRAVVIVAAPGAGKTTRVPPALLEPGPALLLQPRRAAARAIAARIALERGWSVGQEVGWQVRYDRHFGRHTQLLVATEGILTARMQADPLLSDFATIILDEFHERSVHADLAIALAKQAMLARDDLRVVVMSATIDAARVAAYLNDCPVVHIDGVTHPLRIEYAPGLSTADAALRAVGTSDGHILCFEPGAAEIMRTVAGLRARLGPDTEVLPLHGALAPQEQDQALAPGRQRRIVVATNIAETSITVHGVSTVVDTGLEKVARYDHQRGIDSLNLERISAASADQRAGRAARTGPGVAYRLWDKRDRLSPYRAPDIQRIDLTSVALDVLAWGGDPGRFDWFEAPRPDELHAAMQLLERLGATAGDRLTAMGQALASLPLSPRLARVALAGHGQRRVVQAVALLAEGGARQMNGATTTCDLLPALDAWHLAPERTRRAAADLERQVRSTPKLHPPTPDGDEDALLRAALLAGYPDRVAMRREANSPRFLLTSGTGALLGPESGVRAADFIVALDVRAPGQSPTPESRISLASAVEREWLTETTTRTEHALDDTGTVRARRVVTYGALRLEEHPVRVDADQSATLLAAAWLEGPRSAPETFLLRRLAFAGCEVDLPALAHSAAVGARRLSDVNIEEVLPRDQRLALERQAPESMALPSGRHVRLDYQEDGTVMAAVKLQELFGLAHTPRIGPRREPVLLSLLSPGGRPVQMTRDLESFWNRTYPEVRKELRGRYPKHPWPEDPWSATPTHRTKPKPRS